MNVLLRKSGIVSFCSLFLVGCGFQPLMTQGVTGQQGIPQQFTFKMTGSGYSAYKFRRELEKQLSLTPKVSDRAYILKIAVSEGYVPLAYGTDATVSRNQIQATATYTIEDGSQTLAKGAVTAYSAYILNYTQEFSTRSAQAAASERTLISLAEELSREIMMKIRSAPERQPTEKPATEAEKDDRW